MRVVFPIANVLNTGFDQEKVMWLPQKHNHSHVQSCVTLKSGRERSNRPNETGSAFDFISLLSLVEWRRYKGSLILCDKGERLLDA